MDTLKPPTPAETRRLTKIVGLGFVAMFVGATLLKIADPNSFLRTSPGQP